MKHYLNNEVVNVAFMFMPMMSWDESYINTSNQVKWTIIYGNFKHEVMTYRSINYKTMEGKYAKAAPTAVTAEFIRKSVADISLHFRRCKAAAQLPMTD